MRKFLAVFGAVAVVACIGVTNPERDMIHCLYPGDTIAYSVVSLGGIAIVCDWTLETKTRCFTTSVVRYGQHDCMEGEKYPRG